MAKTNTMDTSPLTPFELAQAIEELCGPGIAGHKAFAKGCGLHYTSVARYVQGIVPVPNYVVIMIGMLRTMRDHRIGVPEGFVPSDVPTTNPPAPPAAPLVAQVAYETLPSGKQRPVRW
jgi:hypothetical protein